MSLQDILMALVDGAMAALPRRTPSREVLARCRIIAHRGEHDNVNVMENTLRAFEAAAAAGVWGVEADLRWTADLVPVICHDVSAQRVFGVAADIRALTFAELRQQVPLIPSLQELVAALGGRTHLMLEIKSEPWPRPARQQAILRELLAPLTPGDDFHVLALEPALFERVSFLPARCQFPVAEWNLGALSRDALAAGRGGLFGHYLLLSNRLKARHEAAGQRVGTGFPGSRNVLFRELNRGIEWIFSNDAVKLQGIVDRHLAVTG